MSAELVVIDERLRDAKFVAEQLALRYTVLVLDENQDGLGQILNFIHQRSMSSNAVGFSALHILSHGNTGEIQLGATLLDSSALVQHQAAFLDLAKMLAPGADLMVYGCDVARGATGQAFVTQLARLSGLDVAASTGLTGSTPAAGGATAADWVLETSVGNLEATALQLTLSENLALNNLPSGSVTISGNPTQGNRYQRQISLRIRTAWAR